MKSFGKNYFLSALALASALLSVLSLLTFIVSVQGDMNAFEGEMKAYVVLFTVSCTIFAVISIIFFFFSLSAFRSEKALGDIKKTLESFAAGDFSARLKPLKGGRFSELIDTVNLMAQKLQLLDTMRADFLTNVSHDLKTPMTVIAGYVSNILNGSIPRENEDHYLEIIRKEIFRLSGLIGTLLSTSRIESGEYELNPENFNICEAARIAVISKIDKIDEKKLDFSFDCDEDEILAYGDSEEISQVLVNLLDNAVKFTSSEGKISISAYVVNQTVTVAVYNECEGIPEEDKPFVFDRFFKGDRTRGMEKDSFGLGLYVCKKIIEAHGSEIILDSEAGYCRFSFTLPSGCA